MFSCEKVNYRNKIREAFFKKPFNQETKDRLNLHLVGAKTRDKTIFERDDKDLDLIYMISEDECAFIYLDNQRRIKNIIC
ncbi:hypothetical protein WG909_13065 [Peptostreptococcaceae bacterium AGR-M142]